MLIVWDSCWGSSSDKQCTHKSCPITYDCAGRKFQHLLVRLGDEADQRLQQVRRHPLPEALRPHLLESTHGHCGGIQPAILHWQTCPHLQLDCTATHP